MEQIKNEDIEREISLYAPHTEIITLSTLMAIQQNVNILNCSTAGVGKSHSTVNLLESLGYVRGKDFELVTGHCSSMAFFNILSKNKLTIIDESAQILRNNEIMNMLLSALWDGYVIWQNNKDVYEIVFEKNIIFNTNSLGNTDFTSALKDRTIVNDLRLNSKQIKDKILSSRDYVFDKSVWDEVEERLKVSVELDKNDLNQIYDFIDTLNPTSVRKIKRLKTIAILSKGLYGDLRLMEVFENVQTMSTILKSNLKRSDKVKKLAKLRARNDGRSVEDRDIRWAQRKVKDFIKKQFKTEEKENE